MSAESATKRGVENFFLGDEVVLVAARADEAAEAEGLEGDLDEQEAGVDVGQVEGDLVQDAPPEGDQHSLLVVALEGGSQEESVEAEQDAGQGLEDVAEGHTGADDTMGK